MKFLIVMAMAVIGLTITVPSPVGEPGDPGIPPPDLPDYSKCNACFEVNRYCMEENCNGDLDICCKHKCYMKTCYESGLQHCGPNTMCGAFHCKDKNPNGCPPE
ncbi:hypothetical protein BCR34DRAFT_607401 [Clohesyomyces aquaticus]|uniref:Uncharacterized protein n=1 Tax=Clohesyomyces aquaticus TaxID=1231657 RepID=A0A1Y1YGG0_9PLEO|nr:hypothetical protein BCR34DRAFT_607401 [Clohesyomyces aquaticus]